MHHIIPELRESPGPLRMPFSGGRDTHVTHAWLTPSVGRPPSCRVGLARAFELKGLVFSSCRPCPSSFRLLRGRRNGKLPLEALKLARPARTLRANVMNLIVQLLPDPVSVLYWREESNLIRGKRVLSWSLSRFARQPPRAPT